MAALRFRSLANLVLAMALMGWLNLPTAALAETPYVGMQPQELPQKAMAALGYGAPSGVMVRDVGRDTPSAEAGIMRGDLLLKANGQPIHTLKDLLDVVGTLSAGDAFDLTIHRGDQTLDLTVATRAWPASSKIKGAHMGNLPALGLTMAALSQKIRKQFGVRWDSEGVLVSLIDPSKGVSEIIVRGDVIVQINQQAVWMPEQLLDIYKAAKDAGQKQVVLLVERAAGYVFVILPVR